jgi:ferredoxin
MTTKQIAFLLTLLITLGVFGYTVRRLWLFFGLTRKHSISRHGRRATEMLKVAFAQTKIFRWPFSGLLHALVFWGFLVITIGSIEMVVDGLFGLERSFAGLGVLYGIIIGTGDVFALLIILAVLVFIARRITGTVKRFYGIELKKNSKMDAHLALSLILLLMVTLIGMNVGYLLLFGDEASGVFPVSSRLAGLFQPGTAHTQAHLLHEVNWWGHILLIFVFANILPYSKHFHVFTSVPNVYLASLKPLGYLPNMESVAHEVQLMMDPQPFPSGETAPPALSRFGVKDVEDVTWKNYLDALACTECGRCTAVCPANITGKKLSPRKIFVDLRARMNQKGPGTVRDGVAFDDGKALVGDFVSPEELWACTTCSACAQECPVNINHPALIVDMRRYLVMEEGRAPASINTMFANMENNGAPWQYPAEDRLNWTRI